MWTRVFGYGLLLAAGSLALDWLDYQRMARVYSGEIHILLIALGFLALGVAAGARLMRAPGGGVPEGNPQARESLGISERELAVLREIADGYSNKEIAARLHVSPNTIKTHVAHLLDKLGAKRRTDAVARARSLGLVR